MSNRRLRERIGSALDPDRAPLETSRGRATIRDVARLAGVSVATVSRVVNDRPDVSPETREAVMHHVRALSFSTNRSARALSRGKTGLIGCTIPFVLGDYYSWILSGATEALHEQEMRAVLCPTRHEHDREAALVERLLRGTTDGAILVLAVRIGSRAPRARRPSASRSSWSTRRCRWTSAFPPSPPRTGLARVPRPTTCSGSDTAGSRSSRAGRAGWRARSG